MLAFGLVALFTAAAVVAVAMLGWQIAEALPHVGQLKAALAECPRTREVRFTLRETLVGPRHGQVVALPVKIKSVAQQPLRAAA